MFELKFETDNATFDQDPELEIARILASVRTEVMRIMHGTTDGFVSDANGNRIGWWRFTPGMSVSP